MFIIMRFEWRSLKTDRTALLLAILFALIATLAVLNSFFIVRRQHQAAAEAVNAQAEQYQKTRTEVERVERQRAAQGLPLIALRSGLPAPEAVRTNLGNFRAALPPNFYAVLGLGQSDLYPQNYDYRVSERFSPYQPTVGVRSLAGLFPERSTDNPLLLLLGQFDLAFVMIYLYPLVILALSFNLIASDKEAGTLALTLSQPVRFRTLVLGKVGVRALVMLVFGVLLPALAVQCAELMLPTRGLMLKLPLWALAVIAYGAFWFSLAVCASAFGKSATSNALLLAVCWVVFVLLLPASINLTVQTLRPLPASLSYADAERAANLKFNAEADRLGFEIRDAVNSTYPVTPGDSASQARRDQAYYETTKAVPEDGEMLTQYFKNHPEWPQPATPGQLNYAVEEARREAIEMQLAPVIERMNAERRRQQALLNSLAMLSPAISLQNVLDDLSGASQARQQHFLAQLDSYLRARDAFFVAKIIGRKNILAADFDRLPLFMYHEEPLGKIIKRVVVPTFLLVIIPLVIGLLGLRAYRHYAVIG